VPRGVDTARDPARQPSRINPVTGKSYQGHITGDIRDTPEAQAAYTALAEHLSKNRPVAPWLLQHTEDPDEDIDPEMYDPEQERIERKQEQYREEGWDWGI
jgi:hypothetical protein